MITIAGTLKLHGKKTRLVTGRTNSLASSTSRSAAVLSSVLSAEVTRKNIHYCKRVYGMDDDVRESCVR